MAKRHSSAPAAPGLHVSSLSDLVTIEEYAAVYRLSVKTVRRKIYAGTCRPLPFRTEPKYLWRRDDIVRDINAPAPKFQKSKRGFAVTRARADVGELAMK